MTNESKKPTKDQQIATLREQLAAATARAIELQEKANRDYDRNLYQSGHRRDVAEKREVEAEAQRERKRYDRIVEDFEDTLLGAVLAMHKARKGYDVNSLRGTAMLPPEIYDALPEKAQQAADRAALLANAKK